MSAARDRGKFKAEDIRSAMLLYAVTDSAWLNGRQLSTCVAEAISGGATMIQLREKSFTTDELVELAATILPICRKANIPFVINDDVRAALLSGADGVHVGQHDMACKSARSILGEDAIVGVSVQNVQEALDAQAQGADYLGVGAMFGTPTKPDAVDVSFEDLRQICATVDIPVTAIGGMDLSTVSSLKDSGADGAAVVSAVFAAENIREATRKLRDLVKATVKR